jgi:pyrimidine deaminase RibD-like protein/tetratricopeptide (TPR) repeat protein
MDSIADKLKQGYSYQERARIAFGASDFREAFYLYEEAERLYREAYEWPGTRVFFMQTTALRCLEELIDSGSVEFLSLYQQKAEVFLKEWTDSEINLRIIPARRNQAFAFLLWRVSFSKVSPQFAETNAALERQDFNKARQVLDSLVSQLEAYPFPESDALAAIAQSKRHIVTVKEELRKREDKRDMLVIARAYAAAAEACRLPTSSTSNQRKRLEAFRDWFLSCSVKFQAFSHLNDEMMTDPVPTLNEAEQLFAKAVKHAERAISSTSGAEFPQEHVLYLGFWHAIVTERLQILKFMGTGGKEDYELCIRAWKDALNIAEKFSEQHAFEEVIFPNRFYCRRDLELEGTLLKATRAFRQQNWPDCVSYLEEWRREFPIEYRWSWRDVQVYIRLLFTNALSSFAQENEGGLLDACKKLARLGESEPIGNTGRFFVAEARTLPMKKGIPLDSQYVNLLCTCFPLESYTDNYQTESEIDPLLSLPQRVFYGLDQVRSPFTKVEVQEFKARLSGCVEALVGYIYDYHTQVLSLTEPALPSDLDTLIGKLLKLGNFHWQERKSLMVSLERLKDAINELQDVEEPDQYGALYEKIRGAIKEITRVTPIGIQINSPYPSVEQPKGIEALPDWVLNRSRVGREKLFIFASPEICLEPGKYYLPPEWRKGNRISFFTSERQPLLAIRCQPQWDFWELEAANASLLATEGVTFAYLERAIELSRMCVGSEEKPKVGAVIVKQGKILSEAFKNEGQYVGHAEEIAIKKCQNKRDLNGAIVITTLEPCTTTGRSPDVASCTNLIIQNGIEKVIIGMPDPNRDIRGRGDLQLRRNGVSVAYFPSRLSRAIWQLNKGFIEKYTRDEFRTVYIYRPGQ